MYACLVSPVRRGTGCPRRGRACDPHTAGGPAGRGPGRSDPAAGQDVIHFLFGSLLRQEPEAGPPEVPSAHIIFVYAGNLHAVFFRKLTQVSVLPADADLVCCRIVRVHPEIQPAAFPSQLRLGRQAAVREQPFQQCHVLREQESSAAGVSSVVVNGFHVIWPPSTFL